ncbi:twin transmembrane helix small protein [bacterium]|nr:twin transmembrane helix small protein [bacterium]
MMLLMVATLLVLVGGVIVMGIGGKLNAKLSNKLMTWRVGLQALTIFVVFIAAWLAHK